VPKFDALDVVAMLGVSSCRAVYGKRIRAPLGATVRSWGVYVEQSGGLTDAIVIRKLRHERKHFSKGG